MYGAVGKTLVKELSYDIAGDVIGSGTSNFVLDLTGNVNLSRLAGLSAGMMTSGKSSKVKSLNSGDDFRGASKLANSFSDTGGKYSAFGHMSKTNGIKYDRWNNIRKAGLDLIAENDILLTNKGHRPDPSTYLNKNYISKHLSQFEYGVSIVMTKEKYIQYIKGNSFIGVPDDGTQFVMPQKLCNEIATEANGNISLYEKRLGFDSGYFQDGGGLIQIDINDVNNLNLRLPDGNEAGANSHWLPGGYTDGGIPEVISNLIPNDSSNVKITELK